MKCRRRIISLIIVLSMAVCVLSMSAFAAKETASKTVRVGYFDFYGYIDKNPDGSYSGYCVDYLDAIADYTGYTYEFIPGTWGECLERIESGEIDLLGGVRYTEERMDSYDFSLPYLGDIQSYICVPADSQVQYNDFSKMNGMTVGLVRQSRNISLLAEFAHNKGFSYNTAIYDTQDEAVADMQSGKIDAIVSSNYILPKDVKVVSIFNTEPQYLIAAKNSPLLTEINEALVSIHLNQPDFNERLKEIYFGSAIGELPLELTVEEKDYLDSCGTLKVGVSPDRPPLSQYDDETGEYSGIVVDYIRLIFRKVGLNVEFSSLDKNTSVLASEMDPSYDLVAPYTDAAHYLGDNKVMISNEFFAPALGIGTLYGRPYSFAEGSVVGVPEEYAGIVAVMNADAPNVKVQTYPSDRACLNALKRREIDAMVYNIYILSYLAQSPRYSYVVVNSATSIDIPCCIAMWGEENPRLLSIINKSIASITDPERTQIIIDDVVSVSYPYTFSDYLYANWKSVVCAIVLLLACAIFSWAYSSEKRRTAVALENKNRELETTSHAKSEFLSNMSHEIRTPMNAIIGMTQLAKDEAANSPTTLEYLSQIDSSSQYLLGVINDILDMSRIESGKFILSKSWASPLEVLLPCIEMITPAIRQKNIHFEVPRHINMVSKYEYFLDVQKSQQMIMNLLNNACKFTGEGGTISLQFRNLGYDGTTSTDQIIVKDNGCGMSPEFLQRIFTPFEQEHNIYSGAVKGTGLGLALSQRIAREMGGDITVESKLGKGSTFTIIFPYQYRLTKSEHISTKPESSIDELRGKRILLAEDHPLNATIAIKLLEKQGISVTAVSNGQEAVEAFVASDEGYFDAVLMDIRMPIMDGLSAAKAIRASKHPRAATVPIIAMTANAFEEDVKKSMEAGMNAHLAKPIEPAKLYSILSQQIKEEGR